MRILHIDLTDVLDNDNNVAAAIAAQAPEDVAVADPSAMEGQTFVTSGPGSGWTREFDAHDYALAAIETDVACGGDLALCEAIDPEDGRVATAVVDVDGEWSGDIRWSDDSPVCIECPEVEDAIDHPETVAAMARAVIDCHAAASPTGEWRELIRGIRDAADVLADIDLDLLR